MSLANNAREYYLKYSLFTNPGLYEKEFKKLPQDIREIGLLLRQNIIHRTTLEWGNTGTNTDLRFGDMTKVPWWRQAEDDDLPTVAAILAELYRRDERGFVSDRQEADKLVLTCRFISILAVSILKSRGIPARVRSGFAPYFEENQSDDHWIVQYWSDKEDRWITIDIDGSLSLRAGQAFDPYDMPDVVFDWSANAWLDVRAQKVKGDYFWNAGDFRGLMPIAWELFYDFHSLMNHEIVYTHTPSLVNFNNFSALTSSQYNDIDQLATLMLDPDTNFEELLKIWQTKKEFRLLSGGLL